MPFAISMSRSKLLPGFLISFAGALFLSTKAIIVKLAFRETHTDGLTLLMLRMLLSLPVYMLAAVWTSRRQGNVPMTSRQWAGVIALGLLGYYLSSFFDFIGLQYISAGLERLILFLYPSFSVLINGLVFRERISRSQGWALALTYVGIGIAYVGELRIDTGNPHFYLGSGLIFLCAITYAGYLSGMGRVVPVLGAPKFTTYSMLAATTAILLHYFVRQTMIGAPRLPLGHSAHPLGSGNIPLSLPPANTLLLGPGGRELWAYGLLLALLATVIPSYLLSAGRQRIGANNAAIVTSIAPVSTILQAHFLLGDPIFVEQVIGTVLVIAGVLLISWRRK